MRVIPHAGLAVVLLANGGGFTRLYHDLLSELLLELAGVRMPAPFAPPANPPAVDMTPLVGTYKREGIITTISHNDGRTRIRYEFVDGMAGYSPPLEADLTPVSPTVFAAHGGPFGEDWIPVVFSTLGPCPRRRLRHRPRMRPPRSDGPPCPAGRPRRLT